MPKKKKGTWGGARANAGGAREGAGRPPMDKEAQEQRTVAATKSRWAKIRRIGKGNYNEGLRRLLDWWDETHDKKGK